MGSQARLRVQVCAACCVLGSATAFLAFTQRGMLILGLALVVAAGIALWLWRSRPDMFRPMHPATPVPTHLPKPARPRYKPVAEWPEEAQ